jgi:hypothetical protein
MHVQTVTLVYLRRGVVSRLSRHISLRERRPRNTPIFYREFFLRLHELWLASGSWPCRVAGRTYRGARAQLEISDDAMCESLGRGLCVSTTLVEWPEETDQSHKDLEGRLQRQAGTSSNWRRGGANRTAPERRRTPVKRHHTSSPAFASMEVCHDRSGDCAERDCCRSLRPLWTFTVSVRPHAADRSSGRGGCNSRGVHVRASIRRQRTGRSRRTVPAAGDQK